MNPIPTPSALVPCPSGRGVPSDWTQVLSQGYPSNWYQVPCERGYPSDGFQVPSWGGTPRNGVLAGQD